MNRREFAKLAGTVPIAASMGSILAPVVSASSQPDKIDRLSVHLFSKHLQFLDYRDMAEAAAEMGFDGVDLTVRPNGHVWPERASDDLPRAVDAIKAAGLKAEMLVSGVNSVQNETGIRSLEVASKLGFRNYRMSYYSFDESGSMVENLDRCRGELLELAAFNKQHGLHGAYQNHSGRLVGAYVTDLAYLLNGVDSEWAGCQFDIRHAVVDGGRAWPLGLRHLKSHIRTIALKDFTWAKVDGKWRAQNVPMGEGMVDFDRYFRLLRICGIQPLVSLHFEYPLGGANKGRRTLDIPAKEVFAAMKRDLKLVHRMWENSAS